MTCPQGRLRPASVRHELSRRARPDEKDAMSMSPASSASGVASSTTSPPSNCLPVDRAEANARTCPDPRSLRSWIVTVPTAPVAPITAMRASSTDALLGVASQPVVDSLNRALDSGGPQNAGRCTARIPALGKLKAARTRFRRRESVLVLLCPSQPGGPMRFGSRQATPDARDSRSMLDPRQA